MAIFVRDLVKDDIQAGIRLSRLAGWNQTELDWGMIFDANKKACFCAVDEGKIIGTVTSVLYSDKISWIGMMLVEPEYRNQGIGTMLMKHVLQACQRRTNLVCLDATRQGKPLYERLGFQSVSRINRLIIDKVGRQFDAPNPSIERITSLADDMIQYDEIVFGANRFDMLDIIQRNNPSLARCVRKNGRLTGICLGREGWQSTQIGPVIAKDDEIAKQLVLTVLQDTRKKSVILDVPEEQVGWTKWLLETGFSVKRDFMRMVLGRSENIQISQEQYAIAGPEIG